MTLTPAEPVQKRGTDCAAHLHHHPVPLEDHHVIPKEFGGKTVPSNIRRVCANAHSDVHYFIALLLRFEGLVPWNIEQHFGRNVRNIAQLGYNGIRMEFPEHKQADIRALLNQRYGLEGSLFKLELCFPEGPVVERDEE